MIRRVSFVSRWKYEELDVRSVWAVYLAYLTFNSEKAGEFQGLMS